MMMTNNKKHQIQSHINTTKSIPLRDEAIRDTQYIRFDGDIQQQTGQRDVDDAEPEHRGRVHLRHRNTG